MADRFLALACRRARERRELSGFALAARCGVDQSQISRREMGAAPMLETSLENTAAGLGISVRVLLLEEVAPERITEDELARPHETRVLTSVIRNVIMARGLTQAAVAKLCGVSQPSVAAWVSGAKALEETALDTLAAGLKLSEQDVIREGLLYEPPPEMDQAALRARYLAVTHPALGKAVPSRIAEALDTNRSTLSRFGGGGSISTALAKKLLAWLDEHAPVAKEVEVGVKAGSISSQVLEVLKATPMAPTSQQIAEALGQPWQKVQNVISGMYTRGLIEHEGKTRGPHGHAVVTWRLRPDPA